MWEHGLRNAASAILQNTRLILDMIGRTMDKRIKNGFVTRPDLEAKERW